MIQIKKYFINSPLNIFIVDFFNLEKKLNFAFFMTFYLIFFNIYSGIKINRT